MSFVESRTTRFFLSGLLAMLAVASGPALADPIDLFDYGFNIDGATTEGSMGDPTPGNVDDSLFDYLTGLGAITITISGAGAHNALVFVDHEIDESLNSFFNENAVGLGALAAGQSVEADEPGFVFGDIYNNFLANTLDNTNAVTPGLEDDVSMAIGWDFVLAAGETAVASFFVGQVSGSAGAFNFRHTDADSGVAIYFWSTLDIQGADSDEDGVKDGDDLCPNTAAAADVDVIGCSDTQVDSDGDGVCTAGAPSDGPSMCTGTDNCPIDANPGQADFDTDGAGDACDPDIDGDQVENGNDVCPATVNPEGVPTSSRGLGRNRWTLNNPDGTFTQGPPQAGSTFGFSTTDTAGCSCEQIIVELGLGIGHSKYGCSNSAMMDWVNMQ